ncbi:GNAT family N-acetyltransferase [Sandaracinomonas limnophila]|uniref:GNAT family N-acetyltransferase n=1 Tax=Sandaracinomonas limnophila TaxID=1862386 RepID=A0A437PWD9_9BACT|nr:GNAT family N-acetyltransferase [Sandaracinomonas limnophila]RVU26587.1 GNAT family N-acetyltransferase [Sandaracinomonas limnophila]
MQYQIIEAKSLEEIQQVFQIRIEVFVDEQKCLPSEEFDELDAEARHFLLFVEGAPAATGRFRKTDKGIKIERIATLSKYRGKKLATYIIQHIIKVAKEQFPEINNFYLHSQQTVMPLYASLGFKPYGNTFMEADIVHQAMECVF